MWVSDAALRLPQLAFWSCSLDVCENDLEPGFQGGFHHEQGAGGLDLPYGLLDVCFERLKLGHWHSCSFNE